MPVSHRPILPLNPQNGTQEYLEFPEFLENTVVHERNMLEK
jgi:hypothetical protein